MSNSTKIRQGEAEEAGAPGVTNSHSRAAQKSPGDGSRAKRRALVAGINEYASPNQLPSCVNDAKTFAALLESEYGFDDIVVRTDSDVTKLRLLSDLDVLFASAAQGDQLVFFFSGHGYRQTQDGTLDSVLVTQDSQFFSDTELAQKMAGIPDGVLTIVLDACFSGGAEKAFVTPQGKVEIGKIKRWTAPTPVEGEQAKPQVAAATRIEPFGYLTPLSGPNLARHLAPVRSKAVDLPYRVSDLQDENSKGLLLSACLYNEEAAASTMQTNGLSAFTFALTNSARALGVGATAKNVIAQAGSTLRTLGFDQTPMLKEPMQPPDLGDASFLLLSDEATAAVSAAASPDEAAVAGTFQHPKFIQSLALLAGLFFPTNQRGVNAMTTENDQKNFVNTLSTLGNVVIPMVSVLQQKGFSISDAARIAVAFGPLLANKQTANIQPDGKGWSSDALNVASTVATIASLLQKAQQPAGKDWSNDALNVASTVATVASLLQKAQQPTGKDWSNDALSVASTVATVASLFQKAQQPMGKGWSNDALNVASTVATIASLFQKAQQPDGKGWSDDALNVARTAAVIGGMFQSGGAAKGFDINQNLISDPVALPVLLALQSAQPQSVDKNFLGTALHVIGAAAPIIAAAQKSKSFLDLDMPYTNGSWHPGFPPPYVS